MSVLFSLFDPLCHSDLEKFLTLKHSFAKSTQMTYYGVKIF